MQKKLLMIHRKALQNYFICHHLTMEKIQSFSALVSITYSFLQVSRNFYILFASQVNRKINVIMINFPSITQLKPNSNFSTPNCLPALIQAHFSSHHPLHPTQRLNRQWPRGTVVKWSAPNSKESLLGGFLHHALMSSVTILHVYLYHFCSWLYKKIYVKKKYYKSCLYRIIRLSSSPNVVNFIYMT